jgi:hypothetical protein
MSAFVLCAGNIKTAQTSTPSPSINMSPIENALAEVESLATGGFFCYTTIAKKHGIWRSTLTRRHQAATQSYASKSINQRKLDDQQEQELVRYISRLTSTRLTTYKGLDTEFCFGCG